MSITVRKFRMTDDLKDYEIALTTGWAQKLVELVPSNNRLKKVTDRLIADLRAVTFAASWPRHLPGAIVNFYTGYMNGKRDTSNVPEVLKNLNRRLIGDLRDQIDPNSLAKVSAALLQMRIEVNEIQDTKIDLPLEVVWQSYLDDVSFRYGVWGTQRLCFSSAFSAYDNFLLGATRASLKQPTYKRPREEPAVIRDLANFLGDKLADLCWTEQQIKTARLIRNAIAHTGGEETNELRSLNHPFPVDDKEIQILAPHNTWLLRLIEDRVWQVAEVAVSLPGFELKKKRKKSAPAKNNCGQTFTNRYNGAKKPSAVSIQPNKVLKSFRATMTARSLTI